ncbi:uS8 family ribosomal protein [Candidatus Vampirococcus lugosii]|uniref:Small ribosomal subunit protein uS8 n=1 Tax=Candidatus Vampirococcus lugosii TaxID=2789015 RepID=A0ABS5QL03_9BACT|nr:30S ribosomal protein S8 [Candidatus Vampirococcus lugosii]MBS8121892.1 30S ribosomal protein S8 [Candidatus Vampirococcus lugosii]
MSFVNSPVTDLLIRIKNSYMARRTTVNNVMYSNFKKEILLLLKRYNFIKDFVVVGDGVKKTFEITLKEVVNTNEDILVVKILSKPSRRNYVGRDMLKKVAGGKGIGIVSTNKGLMASHEAYNNGLGGELIAEIY